MTMHGMLRATTAPLLFASMLAAGAASAAMAQSTLFRDVRVFDGAAVLAATDVLVRDGRIAAIGADIAVPAGATVIDGAGRTLLPGLIDAHTHAYGEALREALVFGVTTELDMFTAADIAAAMRAEQAAGRAAGRADLFSAGTLVTAPGGHGSEYGMAIPTLSSADSAQAFVDARIAEGSDWIKIIYDDGTAFGREIPTLDRATMKAVIDAAHRRGRLAVVHISTAADARDAIDAGADGLAHLFAYGTPSPDFAQLVRRSGAFVVPTLVVLRSVTGTPPSAALRDDPHIAPYLTIAARAALGQAFPPGAVGPEGYEIARNTVRQLAAAGVPILAGTDAPNPGTTHGASIHTELELLVDAGLTPTQALAAATSVPAREFGLDDRGRIAEGRRADLVLVDGDPTTDITATRAIVGVWKAGVRLDRDAFAADLASLAEAAKRPADTGTGQISDFEDGSTNAAFGTAWMLTTDSLAGGASTASFMVTDGGANGSRHALGVTGTISSAVPYAWAGVMWSPGAQPMVPANLSAHDGVTFRARGDGGTYRVLIFAQSSGFTPLTYEFAAPAEWTDVTAPWSAFGIDGTDVMAVIFAGGPQPGPFRFEVDDVRLR